MASPEDSPGAIAAGFLLSPLGGFAAGWLFARTECYGTVCLDGQFNEDAAGGATLLGVVLTGVVLLGGGSDSVLLWLLGAFATGAAIAFFSS